MPVTVKLMENGPLMVDGECEVRMPRATCCRARATVALCRCGASANKPYCDGGHKKIGFKS